MSDLRERKRRRTMAHVQAVALDLFDEGGFDAVTIEEIAERAEVSPSTIYRQFGTKEGLIIQDEWDDDVARLLRELFAHENPMSQAEVFLALLETHMSGDGEERARRRTRWMVEHPSVRRAGFGYLDGLGQLIAGTLIDRRGMDPLNARVSAHAMVFGVWAAFEHWYREDSKRPGVEVFRDVVEFLTAALGDLLIVVNPEAQNHPLPS